MGPKEKAKAQGKKAMQQATIQLYGDVSSNLSLRVDECRRPPFLSEAKRNESQGPRRARILISCGCTAAIDTTE
jgi:hypothetical protein